MLGTRLKAIDDDDDKKFNDESEITLAKKTRCTVTNLS